jgi:BMFP domain-containing protein YqiC
MGKSGVKLSTVANLIKTVEGQTELIGKCRERIELLEHRVAELEARDAQNRTNEG